MSYCKYKFTSTGKFEALRSDLARENIPEHQQCPQYQNTQIFNVLNLEAMPVHRFYFLVEYTVIT